MSTKFKWMESKDVADKKRVEKEVLEVLIKNLNDGTITVDAAREAARLTLAEVERIEKHEESAADFYKNLASKYPVFNILYTKIKGDLASIREISAHRQALAAIDSGKIEEAHKIAQGAIAKTAHETGNTN